jgi:hexulose-6-phosphate isomerase
MNIQPASSRRRFLLQTASTVVATGFASRGVAQEQAATNVEEAQPDQPGQILLSVKLGMINAKGPDEKPIPLVDRLSMAMDAGLDGVDFDQAGHHSLDEAAEAVRASGAFVHNAINHAHWKQRFTSPDLQARQTAAHNLEHCIRLSQRCGGSGVLLVPGRGDDGPSEVCEQRARDGISALIPLAARLGQPILFENVWNRMFYDHDTPAPPEQSADAHVAFIDSFRSPWVGQYFDIGNHWKYGRPGEWIRALGHRCVKLDVKGYSRAAGAFTDIEAGDLPWDEVRDALHAINFTGWATAEVGGGGLERLKKVREQMRRVFQL